MWMSPAVILGGLCPGDIAAHRLQLGGCQHSELPANQRDISALRPPYLLKQQHPSGLFEEPPVSPICSVRHFCAWEKKNLFLGVWEPGAPPAASTVPHPASPPSLLPPRQALHHQEPGCGVGLDRRAWGGSYYLRSTMGTVSHEFKASILTEIRQRDLYLVPKSKRFAGGRAMSQWQGEEGSQALLGASTCPC